MTKVTDAIAYRLAYIDRVFTGKDGKVSLDKVRAELAKELFIHKDSADSIDFIEKSQANSWFKEIA